MFRRELPRNKSLFVMIGLMAICFAILFGIRSAEGLRLGHLVLGTIGVVTLLLGALVREEMLAVLASWFLLINAVVAIAAFVATM